MRFFLPFCLLLSIVAVTRAATLQAKVTDVQSGNTIVVSNINRPLKVSLKGIAPPEVGQPFSDAAREHLKALVMDKAVFVEYTNLSDGYLQARVVLNQIDIASQMLRDGAAWYDRSVEYTLTASDRELYASCEQAARAEKRGLWSDPNPVSPWEFRKIKEAAATKPVAATNFSMFRATRKPTTAQRTLSNKYLGAGEIQPGSLAGTPTFKPISPNAAPGEWTTYHSDTPRFSIRVPGNSLIYEYPVLDSDLKIVNLSYVMGSSDGCVFTVMWTKGADDNATDVTVADSTVDALVKGMNTYFESAHSGVTASYSSGRAVRIGSYVGKQYSLSAGPLSGYARVISKRIGDQREIFAVAVFSSPGGEPSIGFLDSLKLGEAKK
jgi:endonuclease YncB( thermonuclease family)